MLGRRLRGADGWIGLILDESRDVVDLAVLVLELPLLQQLQLLREVGLDEGVGGPRRGSGQEERVHRQKRAEAVQQAGVQHGGRRVGIDEGRRAQGRGRRRDRPLR